MITENVSTLKIHKLSQEQYDSALAAGEINDKEVYLVPDEETSADNYATTEQLNSKVDNTTFEEYQATNQTALDTISAELDNKASTGSLTSHINDGTVHFTETERTKLGTIDYNANNYTHPNSGVTTGTYKSVTVDAQGHVTSGSNPTTLDEYGIIDAETKTDAESKLSEAKTYADGIKNDLLNGAGEAYDTLKELGDLIDDNADAIDALEAVAASKASAADLETHTTDASNPHSVTKSQIGLGNVDNTSDADKPISTVTQTALNGKMDKENPTGSGNISFGRLADTTIGSNSVVIGNDSQATNSNSIAIGNGAIASGTNDVAIGASAKASGGSSTAIGTGTSATGSKSVSLGDHNTASGEYSTAMGCWTKAPGTAAISLGNGTTSNGWGAMASGIVTNAKGLGQHVFGSYNIPDSNEITNYYDTSDHLIIVGNGDALSDNVEQSNAHTLDWEGNAWFAGDVYVGSTSGTNKDSGSVKLATVAEASILANNAASGKANSTHTHGISDVTNLQTSLDAKQATISGAATTITSSNLTANRALVSNSSGKVAVSAVTSTELGYLDGVTSNVQTQLNNKAASSHTHTVANISDLTATATELNYMDGVTSNVQTQLNGKSSTSHTHSAATTSAAGLMSASDKSKLDGITSSADSVSFSRSLSSGTQIGSITINGTSTTMYAPTNTDTHYVSGTIVGSSASATTNTTSALSNGSVYLNHTEAGVVRNSHKISGSGGTTVTSDSSGNITISSTSSSYGVATSSSLGLVKSGTDITVDSSGNVSVNDDSHNHVISNIDNLQSSLDAKLNSTNPTGTGSFSLNRTSDSTVGDYSFAEGYNATASGNQSHAEGYATVASNVNSHAEGSLTTASGSCSHAEGYKTTATGNYSHAGGYNTCAEGDYSHAEGYNTTASGHGSHAEGSNTTASGLYSHAGGYYTTAYSHQYAIGKYNIGVAGASTNGTDGSLFVIGNGTSSSVSNAFRVATSGSVYNSAGTYSSGADFAEYFEWADSNPNNEDRRGRFVTLDGEKIRYANTNDNYILGAVSSMGAFIGNTYSESWQGKYLTDVFGELLTEKVDVPEEIETYEVEKKDEETGEIVTKTVERVIPAHTETRYVLNPDYDPEQEYISREFRKEWSPVGLLGQVVVVDDGTCVVGGYCKPSENGIGTSADEGYYVMKRIDETHIKVFVGRMGA